MRDVTGNLPQLRGIFPDYKAPIVRTAPGGARAGDGALGHAFVAVRPNASSQKAGRLAGGQGEQGRL